MKQPKSQTTMRNKLSKRLVFPTVRYSKQAAKLQQIQFSNKSQLFLKMSLLPCDINLLKEEGNSIKILVTSSEIAVHFDGSQLIRQQTNRSLGEWIRFDFGKSYQRVKIKKFGDENVFGKNQIFSEYSSIGNEKFQVIDLKELTKKVTRTSSTADDKTRDIKKFVSNLMSKKINSRRSEPKEPQLKKNINIRRNSGMMRNRLTGYSQNQLHSHVSSHKFPNNSTALSSFRKDLVNESKYTKFSQKQTNVSYQHNISHGKSIQPLNISTECQEYLKMKQKFDTQPYFRNTGSFQNSEFESTINCKISQAKCSIAPTDTLQNKSIHKSEEQQSVEEEIKRSGIQMSTNQFNQLSSKANNDKTKKIKDNDDSSSCYQSQELDSADLKDKRPGGKQENNNIQFSGTLYESKYQ